MLVIVSHIAGPRIRQNWPSQIAFGLGSLGVDLFFVVSGLIITHLLIEERTQAGRIALGRFYARRTIRLWPALWVYLAVVVCLAVLGVIHLTVLGVIAPLLFFTDYVTASVTSTSLATVHTWSLACEEQFYLLWPCALLFIRRRHLKRVLVVAILAAPVVRIAAYVIVPAWRTEAFFQFHDRYDMLAAGCLLGVVMREGWPLIKACSARASVILPGAIFVALAVDVIDAHLSTRLFLFVIGYSLQAVALAVIVGVCVERGLSRPVGPILNGRILRHLGAISYSLYLWQQLFDQAAFKPFTFWPLGVVGMCLCAELSWRCMERPFIAVRGRLRNPAVAETEVAPETVGVL